MPDSAYADDPRVVWPTDGSPSNVAAYLPDPRHGEAGRMVMMEGEGWDGGYVVKGAIDKRLTLRDTWNRLRVFGTFDEAIRAAIGPPVSGKVA